jgi:hypothetical protein
MSSSGEASPDELIKTARGDRTLLEKIFSIFPGYRGYKNREVLRETDKIIREKLFREIKDAAEGLRDLYRSAVNYQEDMEVARELEKLLYICDSLAEKIRHAPYGYKPHFNVVRINEDDLYNLMKYDASLASDILSLRNIIDEVKDKSLTDKLGVEDVRKISKALQTLQSNIGKRDLVLMKVIKV